MSGAPVPPGMQLVKCASRTCICVIKVADAVEREGFLFCCKACAEEDRRRAADGHVGCACHP